MVSSGPVSPISRISYRWLFKRRSLVGTSRKLLGTILSKGKMCQKSVWSQCAKLALLSVITLALKTGDSELGKSPKSPTCIFNSYTARVTQFCIRARSVFTSCKGKTLNCLGQCSCVFFSTKTSRTTTKENGLHPQATGWTGKGISLQSLPDARAKAAAGCIFESVGKADQNLVSESKNEMEEEGGILLRRYNWHWRVAWRFKKKRLRRFGFVVIDRRRHGGGEHFELFAGIARCVSTGIPWPR